MKAGQCQEGERVLRAKIDMAHDNMLMRDPVIYRVKFVEHHRTGNDWVIYPMYDLRTANRIPLNAFRTACVRWSLKTTGPVQLVHSSIGYLPQRTDGIRPAQFELYHHVEAQVAASG